MKTILFTAEKNGDTYAVKVGRVLRVPVFGCQDYDFLLPFIAGPA